MRNLTNKTKMVARKGFTLIELVIVIAIIAILAAIIMPRSGTVFNDAGIASVQESVRAEQTALVRYVAKNHALPTTEDLLVSGGFVAGKPTSGISIGTGAVMANVAGASAGDAAAANGYDLDGNGTADTANESVIEIQINGVTPEDARNISLSIDGAANTPALNAADAKGRVEYPAILAGNTGTVYIYVDGK